MEGIIDILEGLGYVLNSKKKRHLVGGALISVSFLFGGLALTVMTISDEEEDREEERRPLL